MSPLRIFRSSFLPALLASALLGPAPAHPAVPQAFKWTVQYLIDNSQSVMDRPMKVFPRANRALALSPDSNFLYAGYHQSFSGSGEVRKIDTRIDDYEDATKAILPQHLVKAIAVDDQNHVYLADSRSIDIVDGDLEKVLLSIRLDECNGVAVTRERGDLILYASERGKGELHRYIINTGFGGGITGATPAGLGGSGICTIPNARSLRGVAVDPQGRIWVADLGSNRVFVVKPDGSGLTSFEVKSPMAIAFWDDTALVTCNLERRVALVSMDLVVTGELSVPWEELELSPYGNNRDGALAGIAVIPGGKGFYVANEHGQTSNQKSTYGRTDGNSQVIDGKLYIDAFQDDNEPILRAVPVAAQEAPATPPQ